MPDGSEINPLKAQRPATQMKLLEERWPMAGQDRVSKMRVCIWHAYHEERGTVLSRPFLDFQENIYHNSMCCSNSLIK